MKNKHSLSILCIVLLVAALVFAGCTSVFSGSPKTVPTPFPTPATTAAPPATSAVPPCGFTTCHGSDLACGTNAPEICTDVYMIGDKCRQYAHCDTAGGRCALVTTPRFIQCKACAEQCQVQAGADSLAAMTCEEKC
jgi:hypothetical protein